MGKKKALVALAHTLLRIIYHLLKDKKPYQELLGADYLERYRKDQEQRREAKMILELQAKGYSVALA